ncbi:MAG: hypothetical protein J7M34_04940, partial [Anaerolineae bacterium]|nr:hypothetical protein [Anaerolineae bacterium]
LTPTPTPTPPQQATTTPTPARTSTPKTIPSPTATPTPTEGAPQLPSRSGNIRVNQDTGNAAQYSPSVALDNRGRAFAVWMDTRSGNAQLFYSSIDPWSLRWRPALRVDDAPATAQVIDPRIAVFGRDYVIAVWADNRDGNMDIYASELLPPPGGWSPVQKVNDESGSAPQVHPAVVVDSHGIAYAVWEDWSAGVGRSVLRWARRPVSGTWSASQLVGPVGAKNQVNPALTVDRWDNVHLVWESRDPSHPGIYWAILNPGIGVWQGFLRVNDPQPAGVRAPQHPDIGVDANGTLYAVWQDFRNGADDPDIYAALMPDGASAWGTDQRVNHDPAGNAQRDPALAVSPDGTARVVWADDRNSTDSDPDPDIFMATYWPKLHAWVGDTRINDDPQDTPAEQEHPDVAVDAHGGAVIVWVDGRQPDTAPDIFSVRVRPHAYWYAYMPIVVK